MAQTDPWAVVGQGSPREQAPGGWAGTLAPQGEPAGGRRRRLQVAVAVIYLVAAALHPVWLAIAQSGSLTDAHAYAFPQQDANKGYVLLLFAAVGVLVLISRTQVFGLGLAFVLPLHWLATDPGNFRPSVFTGSAVGRSAAIVFDCLELSTVVASVLAAFALRDLLRRNTSRASYGRGQWVRIRVLCLGWGAVLGSGLWLLGGLMNWRVDRFGLTDFGRLHTYYCCGFAADSNFGKAGVIGAFAVGAGFAVAAGFVRSRELSAAWLVGPGLFNAAMLPAVGIRAIFPQQALLGWGTAEQFPNYQASTTLLAGFWLALAGTLVLVAVAYVRMRVVAGPSTEPEHHEPGQLT